MEDLIQVRHNQIILSQDPTVLIDGNGGYTLRRMLSMEAKGNVVIPTTNTPH